MILCVSRKLIDKFRLLLADTQEMTAYLILNLPIPTDPSLSFPMSTEQEINLALGMALPCILYIVGNFGEVFDLAIWRIW